MEPRVIGIIGAGVSGLATAYELRRLAIAAGTDLQIHIFEQQAHVGGNAETVSFKLGDRKPGDEAFYRWADLGVNDINLTAYTRVAEVMKKIGYFDKDDPGPRPNMRQLENTETFYDAASDILITDDGELEHGVSNPEHELATLDRGKQHARTWIEVVFAAAMDKSETNGQRNLDLTVGEFFRDVVDRPKDTLEPYTRDKKIDWQDPDLKRLLEDLRDYFFYPRISAMYFADDRGPETMLLAAPMCYYRTQEGKGSGKQQADRRYFVGGAITWLLCLREYLLTQPVGGATIEIQLHDNFPARVRCTGGRIQISSQSYPAEETYEVDQCVITVHADDAARLLEIDADRTPGGNDPETIGEADLMPLLRSISYSRSEGLCHTYAGLLPADRNQWRSYNVPIRGGDWKYQGYSMTYVCNRHQNDAGDKSDNDYNQAGMPQFFVTLNPLHKIPPGYVLRQAAPDRIPAGLLEELPRLGADDNKARLLARKAEGEPAIAQFKHNLLDRACFEAQDKLARYHQQARYLFFGGGWTNGSGLQEECWEQAEKVAARIMQLD